MKLIMKTNREIKKEFSNTDFKKIKFDVTRKMIIQVLSSETHYHLDYLESQGWSVLCNLMWYHVGKPEHATFVA